MKKLVSDEQRAKHVYSVLEMLFNEIKRLKMQKCKLDLGGGESWNTLTDDPFEPENSRNIHFTSTPSYNIINMIVAFQTLRNIWRLYKKTGPVLVVLEIAALWSQAQRIRPFDYLSLGVANRFYLAPCFIYFVLLIVS